jgi:hypothetical protein
MVYGTAGESLVFLPREQAEELATVWEALFAPTWGEMRSGLSEKRFQEVQEMFDGIDFDTFYAEQRQEHPRLTRKKALEAYRELPLGERLPLDDDPFGLPGPVCDGDWPEWPAQQMLKWMPRDLPGATVEMSSMAPSSNWTRRTKPRSLRPWRQPATAASRRNAWSGWRAVTPADECSPWKTQPRGRRG